MSIRLLGEWRITLDGTPSKAKLYGKVVALLAYLAVGSDRAYSREHLASLLWPLLPTDAARTNLRQTLHYLRQAFGSNASRLLTANRNTVRLSASHANCWLDVDTLTAPLPACSRCTVSNSPALCTRCLGQIQSRLDAYQGESLADLTVTNAPDFDVWLNGQRQRLRGLAFLLSEKLCGAYEAALKLDLALSHAQRCVQLEPWNEAAHRQHIRLLAEKGQHGTAQAYYDTYRSNLGHDQNAEPEASTRALFQTIHKHGLASKHTPLPNTGINPPQKNADRRPVTILCCHLDGAAGMIDPEQLAELRSVCATVLRRYAGHVTQGHDGHIYAYMGYPAASEQAGWHAAQAALEIQACFDAPHRLRVGIHTETIITGIDPSLPDIVGNASALAWQLCRRMRKGGIAISDATECLLHNRFHLQALKPLNAKRANVGTASTTHLVYKLTAPAQAEAVAPPRPASLIGRRTELLRLKKLWHKASRGFPQFLAIRCCWSSKTRSGSTSPALIC